MKRSQFLNRWLRAAYTRIVSALNNPKQIIGLDIGSRAIKLVQIHWRQEKCRLLKCGIKSLDRGVMARGVILDQVKMRETLRVLLEECEILNHRFAVSLAGASVMMRRISIPSLPIQDLEHYMLWEGEQYVPGSIQDVYFDYCTLPHDDNRSFLPQAGESVMPLLLIIAKKEIVEERMALLQQSRQIPSILDVDGLALSNMYAMKADRADSEYVMVLNIGNSMMNMVILRGPDPVFLRDASLGGESYVRKIQFSQSCDREEAEAMLLHDMNEELAIVQRNRFYQDISREIRKTLDHFNETVTSKSIDRFLIYGGYASAIGLIETVQQSVGVPVEIADPFHGIDTSNANVDQEFIGRYAHLFGVSVGLATRTVGDR